MHRTVCAWVEFPFQAAGRRRDAAPNGGTRRPTDEDRRAADGIAIAERRVSARNSADAARPRRIGDHRRRYGAPTGGFRGGNTAPPTGGSRPLREAPRPVPARPMSRRPGPVGTAANADRRVLPTPGGPERTAGRSARRTSGQGRAGRRGSGRPVAGRRSLSDIHYSTSRSATGVGALRFRSGSTPGAVPRQLTAASAVARTGRHFPSPLRRPANRPAGARGGVDAPGPAPRRPGRAAVG